MSAAGRDGASGAEQPPDGTSRSKPHQDAAATSGGAFQRHTTAELVASRPGAQERDAARLPVIVVLDNVRSAYNVGLVFRLCDCVNVRELWLTGITPYPGVSEHATNHINKTGVGGSIDVLPWRVIGDAETALRALKSRGWHIVAAEQGEGSVSWRSADYELPLALLLGHERQGVAEPLLALADEVVELPVRGITNSLNVALCASALLYEVLGRSLPAGPDRTRGV